MDGRRHDNLLLIVARAPVAGETKTRLGATIGMDRAARLYRGFLTDLAVRFSPAHAAAHGYDVGWAFTPPECDFATVVAALDASADSASAKLLYVRQEGDDLGARQANLLRWGRDHGYARTVLIASDSPQLPATIPVAAFAALAERDVALGRVHDGGYYLIGLRGDHDVLTGIPMSTAAAAEALAARVAALGLRLAELPPTFDVDTEADLALLVATLAPDGGAAPATWQALRELGLVPSPSATAGPGRPCSRMRRTRVTRSAPAAHPRTPAAPRG